MSYKQNMQIPSPQIQVNSIFHMKRPYDLMAFINQERKVDLLESLKEDMSNQANLEAEQHSKRALRSEDAGGDDANSVAAARKRPDLDVAHAQLSDGSNFEAKFFAADDDCQNAGVPLTEFDLFVSTLIHPDRSVPGLAAILKPDEDKDLHEYDEPVCYRSINHFYLDGIDDLHVNHLPSKL